MTELLDNYFIRSSNSVFKLGRHDGSSTLAYEISKSLNNRKFVKINGINVG